MTRVLWDLKKEQKNIAKHGVSFSEASEALEDPLRLVEYDEEHSYWDEDRYVVVGRTVDGLVLVVIETVLSDDAYRIISARKANRREKLNYELI
jgi:uncharacterized DUF497 family protein